jgi:hypothetical protein
MGASSVENLPGQVATSSPETLRALAQHAESWGFDSLWFADHVVIPRTVRSAYPYAVDGVSTFDPDRPLTEAAASGPVRIRRPRSRGVGTRRPSGSGWGSSGASTTASTPAP